jgi:hypothetical protein
MNWQRLLRSGCRLEILRPLKRLLVALLLQKRIDMCRSSSSGNACITTTAWQVKSKEFETAASSKK